VRVELTERDDTRVREAVADAIGLNYGSYVAEEPVIYVIEGLATRADYSTDRSNPNRWWSRELEI
jgi:hypothetical protein